MDKRHLLLQLDGNLQTEHLGLDVAESPVVVPVAGDHDAQDVLNDPLPQVVLAQR